MWKAVWSEEFECAVKVLTPGAWHPHYLSWCLERLRREGDHPGLVRVYSYDLTNDPPHLSMALLPEGTMTLDQLAGRLPAREAWVLLDSLAATLGWLHGEGIVHTGLTAGNVFVCSGPTGEPAVLVSDVGQGWLSEAPVKRLHHQLGYIAPEHWRAATKLLQEGRAQPRDVYAFGVIAWRLLTGGWPRGEKVFNAILASPGEEIKLQPAAFGDWLEKESELTWPSEAVSQEEAARRAVVEQCLSCDPAVRHANMNALLEVLKASPLPPPAVAAPVENWDEWAVKAKELKGDKFTEATVRGEAGEDKVSTGDAFAEGAGAPRKRRFSLSLPGLSLRLQRNREDAAPFWRPLLGSATAGFAILAAVGTGAYAFKERSARITAVSDLRATQAALEELQTRIPRVETDAANARSEAAAAKAEQAAAARHACEELLSKVLSTQPVADDDLPAWRAAVTAVAEQCSTVLENAPADATGMEARWQLAQLKYSLGAENDALTVLEKLNRDLEAAAIAAAGDFPAEMIRLTGRVESLTGRILISQQRTEDAMPHLRKASDFLEKWVAANALDRETARSYAHNLLLEARGLALRGQPEPSRAALMKIEGLVAKPEEADFKPEDAFLLADAQFELGRLDAMQTALPEPGKEAEGSPFDTAIARYTDGLKLLLDYDSANKKSVPCRARMAKAYYEMGLLFARGGNAMDASVAYKETVQLYTELMREKPEDVNFTLELAAVYNDAAILIRNTEKNAAGIKEALTYQDFSVLFLQNLNESNPLDNRIRKLLSASLVLNGDLLEASGATGKALERYNQAVAISGDLLADNSLSEGDRRDCRRISARGWTGAAGLHEKAGRRDDTVSALTKAYADWEFSPVEDPADQKKMVWVKEKLDKLKPR